MKNIWLNCAFAVFFSVCGCTTATYGIKPTPVGDQPDTYTFKIFTGGFSAGATADKRAEKELEKYKVANGYIAYTILDKQWEGFPSGVRYKVKFLR